MDMKSIDCKEIGMDVRLMVQGTPNPNAFKFVLNVPVKSEGNVTYKTPEECMDNPLAKAVFEISGHIREVYFFDNYVTVTQDGLEDWEALEEKIKIAILAKINNHDPNFKIAVPKKDDYSQILRTPEMDRIDAILNDTVRPALQMDGGDLQLVSYKDNVLTVFYQGACGSCPSASMGTLMAIENLLRNEFNPEIVVQLKEGSY
ncbi:MAG TPA: NifU family protein [Candidatus Omnitrophica bacterium]|nr:NifU family protein [Candidatus Omnitrophota bacterium]